MVIFISQPVTSILKKKSEDFPTGECRDDFIMNFVFYTFITVYENSC